MADLSVRPSAPASSTLAELHHLCDEDYAKGQRQRAEHVALSATHLADPAAPTPDPVTPDSLPGAVSDLLTAVVEALTVPLPALDDRAERAYHRLLERRTSDVRIILASILDYPDVPIDNDPAAVRTRTADTPVAYALYEDPDGGQL